MWYRPLRQSLIDTLSAVGEVTVVESDAPPEEVVRERAARVSVAPQLFVWIGAPSATSTSSDLLGSQDEIPIVIVVAASDLSSVAEQHAKARDIAWNVRRALQGARVALPCASDGFLRFVAEEHVGTDKNMTIYSVQFLLGALFYADAP